MSLTSYRAAPPRVTCIPRSSHSHFQGNSSRQIQEIRQYKSPLTAAPTCRLKGAEKKRRIHFAICRPGSDLLSHVLRRSTIGAEAFHGRVRNGIGCSHLAITTRSAKRKIREAGPPDSPGSTRPQDTIPHHHSMGTSNENDQANRAISTGKLHALLHFHTRPINVVVFHGSQGTLVSRWVSRLDAFSGYPFHI